MDNGAASAFSGRPAAVLKHLVSVHVGLDYYDMAKFKKMTKKSTVITTLFQTSGLAANQMGHLNVTRDANGDLRIRSAVPGSDFVSNIVKEVMTRPYDISVLQISSVIVPPGIENINTTSAPPPKPSRNATSPAPGPSHSHKNKTSAPVPAPSSDDDVAPAPSDDDGAPTPASDPPGSDDADAPGPADDDDASSAPRGAGSFVGAVATGVICAAAAAAAAAAL
ncbi:hypothetical protein H6P81_000360 [Aristolochia fimbriata]|uniref:FAS1 domain-containing protein n=1 Tax=Aristolochia fimbriata TaxID=158543 RepID=A0AAV7F7T9_ARIFI|nr:hypothetical protein H6P81_000360 [Aristolochia fimbriata]